MAKVFVFPHRGKPGYSVFRQDSLTNGGRGLNWTLREMKEIDAVEITRTTARKLVPGFDYLMPK